MKVLIVNKNVMYLSIAVLLIILVFILLGVSKGNISLPTFNENKDIFYKGNIDTNTIAFTCNVDWGEEYIDKMLEILNENSIKITFFVTGSWAKKNQELLIKMYNEGHEIGNHGYFHKNYGPLSFEENKEQILKADRIIKGVIGETPKYFAPPSGDYSENTINASKELNYKLIMWSIDTIDWRKDSTKEVIINRVIPKLENSSIVLMHPKEETIKALPEIIRKVKENGYKIGKVSDIIK